MGAIRTRSTRGRMLNRSGGSSRTASPSIPAGTGRRRRTSKVGALHCRTGRCGARPRSPRPVGAPAIAIPSRPSSIAGRVPEPTARPEPVAVVRDQDHGARVVLVSVRARPAQVEPRPGRPEGVGHRVEQRAELRVAVAGALDRLGVDAERDVVDEHAPVDLGEIDPALAAVRRTRRGRRRRRRDRPRGRGRSGFAFPPGCRRREGRARRRSRRRSPASRRRRPSRARRRRGRRRRGRSARGPGRGRARSARCRAPAPRSRARTARPCRRRTSD